MVWPRKPVETRRHIVPFRGGEIVQRVQAAKTAQTGDHVFGDCAGIEGIPAAAGDGFKRIGKGRLRMPLAYHWHASVRHENTPEVFVVGDDRRLRREIGADAGGHRIAVAGVADGWLQKISQLHTAMIAIELRPGIDRSGDDAGMRALTFDLPDASFQIPLGRRRHRRLAGTIEGHDFAAAARCIQAKAIAADACGFRLDYTLHGAGGNCCIHGVAAALQDVDSSGGG